VCEHTNYKAMHVSQSTPLHLQWRDLKLRKKEQKRLRFNHSTYVRKKKTPHMYVMRNVLIYYYMTFFLSFQVLLSLLSNVSTMWIF